MSIIITNASLEHKSALLDFYSRVYRPDHPLTNEEFLMWFLHKSPYNESGGLCCKLACDGEKIVGHYAYIPVKIWADGKVLIGRWATNLVVDEEYRRQGISKRLIDALASEVDVAVDIGATAELAEGILVKQGWTNMGKLRRYVGVLDEAGAALLTEDRSRVPECTVKDIPEIDSTYDCELVHRFSGETDAFWERFRERVKYAVPRNLDFLNWRYVLHPFFKYALFELRNERSTLMGIAVARLETVKGLALPLTVCRIVEFIALEHFEEPLLRSVLRYAKEQGAVFADFFCAARMYENVFARFGFKPPPIANVFARFLNPVLFDRWTISFNGKRINKDVDTAIFSSQENWYATSGDGDQDRPNTNVIGLTRLDAVRGTEE